MLGGVALTNKLTDCPAIPPSLLDECGLTSSEVATALGAGTSSSDVVCELTRSLDQSDVCVLRLSADAVAFLKFTDVNAQRRRLRKSDDKWRITVASFENEYAFYAAEMSTSEVSPVSGRMHMSRPGNLLNMMPQAVKRENEDASKCAQWLQFQLCSFTRAPHSCDICSSLQPEFSFLGLCCCGAYVANRSLIVPGLHCLSI